MPCPASTSRVDELRLKRIEEFVLTINCAKRRKKRKEMSTLKFSQRMLSENA